MRHTHVLMLAAALGASALIGLSVAAHAGELDASAANAHVELLLPAAELDQINMSIVDEKLAMSLAVEAHVQMELSEFALDIIGDSRLKALTDQKLRGYRQLYSTLNELTGGRANAMLARNSRARNAAPSSPAANAQTPKPSRQKALGVGDIMQNTATKAILRVRLEIANRYTDLLRAELESSPPGDFDRRYIGIELYNQLQVLAMLRVFEEQASPDLARVIHLATTASEAHLLESRQVIELLKNSLPLPLPKEQVVNTTEVIIE
ncbi:MAG: hypothetical protein WD845_16060 [Pirellulales bacterium]